MSKNKLSKFADLLTYPNVIQPAMPISEAGGGSTSFQFPLRGHWAERHFHNGNPIVLELGCGKGEYTVGLARSFPNKNFIGVDIKGARIWTGATTALQEHLSNASFLRTRIEFIEHFFAPDEVSEIWLTFPDPQMKKCGKRLTSTFFLNRYRSFLSDNGIIHLKTDSNFLFTYTSLLLKENSIEPIVQTTDLYKESRPELSPSTPSFINIKTFYEQQWLDRGIPIKYLSFALPHSGELKETEADIPHDTYRSFSREARPKTMPKKRD